MHIAVTIPKQRQEPWYYEVAPNTKVQTIIELSLEHFNVRDGKDYCLEYQDEDGSWIEVNEDAETDEIPAFGERILKLRVRPT